MRHKTVIGVGPGVRIILWEDNSVDCMGATPEVVLLAAEARLKFGDRSKDELDSIRKWVNLMRSKIDMQETEDRIQKSAEPRIRDARKMLPKYAHEEVERLILEQERDKRKPE